MKASEIRGMGKDEVRTKLDELKKELFNLKLQKARGQLNNPMKLGHIKKDIARIMTIISTPVPAGIKRGKEKEG